MKLSKNTLIKLSVGVLSLFFILSMSISYNLYGNSELGMPYTLGNGLAFFFLILTIVSFCAALIFIVIGLIKKIRKSPAKKSLVTSITLFLTSVISIIVLLFTITKVTNMEEEYQALQAQKKKEASYLIAAASFYNNINTFKYAASYVLSEYSTTWSNAIDNRHDFNNALSSKRKEIDGTIVAVDTFYSNMGNDLKLVSEAAKEQPNKYKETYEEYKKIYGIITALNEQAQSPSGSLISFNQNVNALIQEYQKAAGNINIAITDEIKSKADELKPTDQN
ncbi:MULTISPECIES: hypothetical protein [Bacillus]|uniref:Group-specific protein n=1 Tax=Bacillus cereus TaxID=1396 RepID=A0A2A8ITN6_BACCE|nr:MULTISPECIES: hypothetical protein [Bacillus]PER22767.1 hypothetical protein CN476_19370 [Bacillus cereus]PFA58153.1 hypothetical protein CN402_20850 [Bacillus sp. AFS015896]PGL87901.1 hypothetical protein CN931_01575 [Bacillus sp. AFS054943]PGT98459.1 hypothetical protein COD19_21700 [Bacillus cereus]PGX07939.1 hypothetical protein COE07_20630 [Bacillus sp. AFS033286]